MSKWQTFSAIACPRSWTRCRIIGDGPTFVEPAWNCDDQTVELGIVLCNHTGFIGPWIISAIVSDGIQDIYVTWYISYEVWHPPVPVVDDETEDASSDFDVTTNQMLFLGLGVLIVILLAMLLFGGKKPPKTEQSVFSNPNYQPMNNQYSAVPSAPVLPPASDAFGKW